MGIGEGRKNKKHTKESKKKMSKTRKRKYKELFKGEN